MASRGLISAWPTGLHGARPDRVPQGFPVPCHELVEPLGERLGKGSGPVNPLPYAYQYLTATFLWWRVRSSNGIMMRLSVAKFGPTVRLTVSTMMMCQFALMMAMLITQTEADEYNKAVHKAAEVLVGKPSPVYIATAHEIQSLKTMHPQDQQVTSQVAVKMHSHIAAVIGRLQSYPPRDEGVVKYFYEWSLDYLNTTMVKLKPIVRTITHTETKLPPLTIADLGFVHEFSSAWTLEKTQKMNRATSELVKKRAIIGELKVLTQELVKKKSSEVVIKERRAEHIKKRGSQAEVNEMVIEVKQLG